MSQTCFSQQKIVHCAILCQKTDFKTCFWVNVFVSVNPRLRNLLRNMFWRTAVQYTTVKNIYCFSKEQCQGN